MTDPQSSSFPIFETLVQFRASKEVEDDDGTIGEGSYAFMALQAADTSPPKILRGEIAQISQRLKPKQLD